MQMQSRTQIPMQMQQHSSSALADHKDATSALGVVGHARNLGHDAGDLDNFSRPSKFPYLELCNTPDLDFTPPPC